ncbi:RICIN domain-containing protein [Kitasatospora purpeofusca]|uniref:RICIN domain-containing protein n=1 Tax=Kitasatospora TaxID=2063 RepID=UPI0005B812B4|nr:RICIN domain-containing protein [Kitasatospora sp. MBT66]
MRRLHSLLLTLCAVLGLAFANSGTASAITYNQLRDGYYLGAPLCATPQGNSTANGTVVTTWSCTGSDLQQWTYRGGGWIYHEASGKCLTPRGNASAENGAVLTLWTCDWSYTSPQKFVVALDPMKIYTSWGGKCITNKGGSMGDGAYLTLWTCSNSRIPEQEWSV